MAGEAERTLGDYFALQRGTSYKSALLDKPGPILLGLATIARNGGFRDDSLRTYGGDSPAKLLVQPGDLYLSLKDVTQSADLLGAVARLPKDQLPGRLTQDTVRLVPVNDSVPADYLYWLLRTPQYRTYCRAHATGTTNLGLSREDFLAFPVPPVTSIRSTLVRLLESLDDKIELNRRMNATLEGISRAIFKSWFVDFDPVRQKAAGKQPVGMDAQTAALFPDSFEDSEIGEVPKGWRVLALPEVADIMSGGTPRKSDAAFWGGDIPWVSPKGMAHIHVDDSSDRVTEAAVGNGTRLVPAGAVLVMVRGMGLHDGVRVSQAKCPVTFNQDVKALVATGIPPTHLLYWMLHESSSLLRKVQSSGHGTGVLPTEFLAKLTVVIPGSNDALGRLVAYLEAFDAQHFALVTQGRTLAALRDSLLPKLLSGEIRVPDAEEAVEEALA